MRLINDIIVHCTANGPFCKFGAKEIDRIHRARGFRCIGYHYVIRRDGTIERGRAISQPGSHCYGHNAHSIGVAYVGGIDAHGKPEDNRTPEQKQSLLKLLTNLVTMYRCGIHGHRDYSNKACPSFDATKEYAGLYRQIVLKIPGQKE